MMETVILDTMDTFEAAGHSSKGNRLGRRQGDIWYKASHMGYEGPAEVVAPHPLHHTSTEDFVYYDPVWIQYAGQKYLGYQSRGFLLPDEELITIDRLFRLHTGRSAIREMGRMTSVQERVVYLVENVIDFTGLETFGQYLTTMLRLNAFSLNEDRRMNNVAVFRNAGEDKYRPCSYFDRGLSLYSDIATDLKVEWSPVKYRKIVEAKPFSQGFDEQTDEAEAVYRKQLSFHSDSKAVRRGLAALERIYEESVIQRVEKVLDRQRHKYEYLFSQVGYMKGRNPAQGTVTDVKWMWAMLSYIWTFMIFVRALWSALHGNIGAVTQRTLGPAGEAVTLCITMLGVMSLWTGVPEVGERAGLIEQLPKRMKPILYFSSPKILEEHPANEHIVTNMIANTLGFGWTAIPADLRAMEVLKDLEEERHTQKSHYAERGTANNEMYTFLIVNISSLQLIPTNMIAYRSQCDSINPTAIVGPTLIATPVSTVMRAIFVKLIGRSQRRFFPLHPPKPNQHEIIPNNQRPFHQHSISGQ